MLKLLSLTIFLVDALFLLTAKAAFSSPKPLRSQGSFVARAEIDTPVCFMRTPNGRTLNLTDICGTGSANAAQNSRAVQNSAVAPQGNAANTRGNGGNNGGPRVTTTTVTGVTSTRSTTSTGNTATTGSATNSSGTNTTGATTTGSTTSNSGTNTTGATNTGSTTSTGTGSTTSTGGF